VAEAFEKARGLHGSPRPHADLREAGWQVAEKTVADSMRRQGLVARKIRRLLHRLL
jgi:putative transposase